MKKINYSSSVNYKLADPYKIFMQKSGLATSINLQKAAFSEVSESRGETAYVIDMGNHYLAIVQEGLGSKNIVADEVKKFTGKTYYDSIAQDTVASIVNDLVPVGAKPLVVNAYWSMYSYDWLKDEERTKALIKGWRKACDSAGVSWGGGETQSLPDTIQKNKIELAGCGVGIIKPKKRLTLGDKLKAGDAIILIGSSGIHANGLSMARTIASRLPKGYATKLSNGKTFGESLLIPTHIYAKLVQNLFKAGIDIHYMVNITGHGWRKLMRANRNFSYLIEKIPKVQPLFDFIQKYSGNSDEEMYGTFNMGAGFAVFVPQRYVKKTLEIVKKNKFKALNAGVVEKGKKQVIIKPKNIIFKGETLDLR